MQNYDIQFGQFALSQNLIDTKTLTSCVNLQKSNQNKSLSDIFLERGFLNRQQVESIKNHLSKSISQIGNYKVLSEIGRGGMGVIYKVYDTISQRNLALKILIHGTDENNKRFLREAKTVARLQHPNIVKFYEINQHRGKYYFTMDLISGQSLQEIMDQANTLSVKKIITYFLKICQAMHYAHSQGVIHRDLKPANIMIDTNDEPKIMDFGLAKLQDASQKLSMSGAMIGTIFYMSPEQVMGRVGSIDKRSDTYSLGAVLYILLTGRVPFTGNSITQISRQILEKEVLLPSKIKPSIAKDLDFICIKALAKKKEERYQTAEEMENDLNKFLHGEHIRKHTRNKYRKYITWFYKNIILLSIFCLVSIVAFVLFYSSYISLQKKYEQLKESVTNMQKILEEKDAILATHLKQRVTQKNGNQEEAFLLYEEGLEALKNRNEDLALKKFTQSVEKKSNYIAAYVSRSKLYYRRKSWSAGLADISKILEMDPYNLHALYYSGVGHVNNKLYDEAIPFFKKITKVDPRHQNANFLLGSIFLNQKKYFKPAIRYLEISYQQKPELNSSFMLGEACYKLKKYNDALNWYKISISLGNSSQEVYAGTSGCYAGLGEYKKALQDMEHLLTMSPKNYSFHNAKAYFLSKLGNFSTATTFAQQSLDIKLNHTALDTMGDIKNHIGAHKEAIALSNRSVSLNKNNGDAYYNRAIAYYMLGNKEKAISNYQQAFLFPTFGAKKEYFNRIPKNSILYQNRIEMERFFNEKKR